MKTLDEIHDMIQTAQAGDGDRLPDICQALLERLRSHERSIDVLAEQAERGNIYSDPILPVNRQRCRVR